MTIQYQWLSSIMYQYQHTISIMMHHSLKSSWLSSIMSQWLVALDPGGRPAAKAWVPLRPCDWPPRAPRVGWQDGWQVEGEWWWSMMFNEGKCQEVNDICRGKFQAATKRRASPNTWGIPNFQKTKSWDAYPKMFRWRKGILHFWDGVNFAICWYIFVKWDALSGSASWNWVRIGLCWLGTQLDLLVLDGVIQLWRSLVSFTPASTAKPASCLIGRCTHCFLSKFLQVNCAVHWNHLTKTEGTTYASCTVSRADRKSVV